MGRDQHVSVTIFRILLFTVDKFRAFCATRLSFCSGSHRFRATDDMQYAFAYFFYVMNRNKLIELNVVEYLSTEIDTNRDGIVDHNEQRTLTAVVSTNPITQQDIDAVAVRPALSLCSLYVSSSYFFFDFDFNFDFAIYCSIALLLLT